MIIERILAPIDFSDCSPSVLEFASRLARESGAQLLLLHVDEPSRVKGNAGLHAADDAASDRAQPACREQLHRIAPTSPTVRYRHLYRIGSPIDEILQTAEHENVDVIVIGSHGRSNLARLLTGSVAEGVMRRATCPVLVVKQPVRVVEDVSDIVLAGPPG